MGLLFAQGLLVISRYFIKIGNVHRFSAFQSCDLIPGENVENEK